MQREIWAIYNNRGAGSRTNFPLRSKSAVNVGIQVVEKQLEPTPFLFQFCKIRPLISYQCFM